VKNISFSTWFICKDLVGFLFGLFPFTLTFWDCFLKGSWLCFGLVADKSLFGLIIRESLSVLLVFEVLISLSGSILLSLRIIPLPLA